MSLANARPPSEETFRATLQGRTTDGEPATIIEFGMTVYRDVLRWPIGGGAEGCLGRLRPQPRMTQQCSLRWIVPLSSGGSVRLPGMQAVLSVGWRVVATSCP